MRFLNFAIAIFLFSAIANASTSKSYLVQFWTQDLSSEKSLPMASGQSEAITFEKNWNFSPSQPLLWEQVFENNHLKTVIQVFAPTATYLAQQVTIYENNELIGRCTAYFASSELLIPSACSAKSNKTLIGFSIIQK